MTPNKIKDAITDIAKGKFVIVTDDCDRENEGDLIIAAEKITPKSVAFMVNHTSGLICVPMKGKRLDELKIPLMVSNNTESLRTAFTVSVDCALGTTTGISAEDRATTIRALANPKTLPEHLNRPGHIFPLRYKEGGVLKRAGHTEAAIDLISLAGLNPTGVLCELVNKDGTMARKEQLISFAKEQNLTMISVADLVRYRLSSEKLVKKISTARIPTKYGEFIAHAYESIIDGTEHLAFVKGNIKNHENTLVRVHSECLTGDVFGSKRCDCGSQLDLALEKILKNGSGVLVYLRGHEGRGIGLAHKLRAYNLQDKGRDTVQANLDLGFPIDSREYGIGAQILKDLGITAIRLMTNNPEKYGGLEGYNLEITERVPLISPSNQENRCYLLTKQEKLGHLLELEQT